jgi:hypothetical protein
VLTDVGGRYTVAGIPVGTRCTLRASLKIGETWHLDAADFAVNKHGPLSAPDLVLKPQASGNRQRANEAAGKAE